VRVERDGVLGDTGAPPHACVVVEGDHDDRADPRLARALLLVLDQSMELQNAHHDLHADVVLGGAVRADAEEVGVEALLLQHLGEGAVRAEEAGRQVRCVHDDAGRGEGIKLGAGRCLFWEMGR
jgi:hypothetical protein